MIWVEFEDGRYDILMGNAEHDLGIVAVAWDLGVAHEIVHALREKFSEGVLIEIGSSPDNVAIAVAPHRPKKE